jgi:hypothetical protein
VSLSSTGSDNNNNNNNNNNLHHQHQTGARFRPSAPNFGLIATLQLWQYTPRTTTTQQRPSFSFSLQ